jgi:hypothetical protein
MLMWVLLEDKLPHSSLPVLCRIHQCQVNAGYSVCIALQFLWRTSVQYHLMFVQYLYEFQLLLLLLSSGCGAECRFPSAAVNTCRRNSMGWAARGGLDDLLPKPLDIWAFSVGHSQLWGLPKCRDEQNTTANGVTGMSPVDYLCQGFWYILPVSACSLLASYDC